MKLLAAVLLVLTTILSMSSATFLQRLPANYDAIINPEELQGSGFKPQEYQLEQGIIQLPNIPLFPNNGVEPQRICLVVRCFPRGAKYQICRCIKWKK